MSEDGREELEQRAGRYLLQAHEILDALDATATFVAQNPNHSDVELLREDIAQFRALAIELWNRASRLCFFADASPPLGVLQHAVWQFAFSEEMNWPQALAQGNVPREDLICSLNEIESLWETTERASNAQTPHAHQTNEFQTDELQRDEP